MRFTVKPESGDPIILSDTTNSQTIGWYLVDSVVEGWFGTPAPRESAHSAFGHDGDGFPSTLTQGSRVVTLYGALECPSTIDAARAKDRLNALFGQKLEIIGEDADGTKRCWGFLSDDPQPKYLPGQRIVKFSLVITCPYPVKLGNEIEFISDGVCHVINNGNAPSYPKIVVSGRVTSLLAYFNGHTFSWSGNASSLSLDLFDASASSGEITEDDAFEKPPGEHDIYISTSPQQAKVSVLLASAWR